MNPHVEHLYHLEDIVAQAYNDLYDLRSGTQTHHRRALGAVEHEDMTPREIEIQERIIAVYEPLIAELRAELGPLADAATSPCVKCAV